MSGFIPTSPLNSSQSFWPQTSTSSALEPEMEGLIVPSKFYGIAAVARPTIFVGSRQGEIARLVEHAKCGLTIEPGNAEKLLAGIIELAQNRPLMREMGERARLAFEREWDRCHGWQDGRRLSTVHSIIPHKLGQVETKNSPIHE